MMKKWLVFAFLGMFGLVVSVKAADKFQGGFDDELSTLLAPEAEGVQSFQGDKDAWRRDADNPKGERAKTTPVSAAEGAVLSAISDKIGKTALENITDAEQVFCYEVATKSDTYVGYSLDGFALRGFCGVLDKKQRTEIVNSFLKNPSNVDLEKSENCLIQPKIMLRFVRGIDSTDMLLSSPCHSFVIFYAGKIVPFNLKPAADKLDSIADPMSKKRQDFVSPALLGQLLPLGVAETAEQKELVNKRKQPIRGWEDGETARDKPSKKEGGWNNLNLNL